MNTNKQTVRSKNAFGLLKRGMLLACLVLGFGFAELQAQDLAQYYFSVDGEQTTDATFEPGDTFDVIIGINYVGPYQGFTISLDYDPTLVQVVDEAFTDLSNAVFFIPLPITGIDVVSNELGHIQFSKATFNTYNSTGDFDVFSFTMQVLDDVDVNTVTEIMHVMTGNNMSDVSFSGESALDPNTPNLTINIDAGVEPLDCEELQANIGDSCDDDDDNTENDTVNDDCECVGTSVVDCADLGLNIGDSCDDDDDDTENDLVNESCECVGAPITTGIPNDECTGAIAIECGETITGNNTGATNTGITTSCGTSLNNGPAVWYTLSGVSGVVTVTTCSEAGPNFDTKIGVFSGSCGTLVCVGGDDDAATGEAPDLDCTIGTATANRASYLEFDANSDSTYYIAVVGFSATAIGEFDLTVSCADFDCEDLQANIGDTCDDDDDSTINDLVGEDCTCLGEAPAVGSVCDGAFTLECNADPVTFSSAASNGTNTTDCLLGDNGLWFTFTGTGDDITINSTASFDHEMSINAGSCDVLENIGCDDQSVAGESFTIQNSIVGIDYYVYIARYNSGSTVTGDITIDIDCEAAVVCEADGGFIVFDDATESVTVCVDDNDPSSVDVDFFEESTAPEGYSSTWVITDLDGNLLGLPATIDDVEAIDFDDAGAGNCLIWFLSYDAENSNVGDLAANFLDGLPANADSLTGCFDLSNALEVIRENCAVDCPELGLNIGDACDDDDDSTDNDVVNEDCQCVGTPVFVCEADGGTIEFEDGSETVTVCVDDNDPSSVDVSFLEESTAPEGYSSTWVVTDAAGNLLGLPATIDDVEAIDFDDAGAGNCLIWFLSYDADNSNVGDAAANFLDGLPVNADALTGCFDLSNPLEVVRENCAVDCPELGLNIGDACDDDDDNTDNDVVNADCECAGTPVVVVECANYVYYLADHGPDNVSDLYQINVDGGNAELTYIASTDVEVHIAFNEVDNLVYAISKADGSYQTLDPNDAAPAYSATTSLGLGLTQITQAVFNSDGKLLLGSANQDVIYSVNVLTDNAVSVFDGYSPIEGGDLSYALDGSALYMATREGNGGLYSIMMDGVGPDQFLAALPNDVTGMSTMSSGNLLISANGETSLIVKNSSGADVTTLPLTLDGNTFTLRDGDMTSGCNTGNNNLGECENFTTWYANHGSDIDGTDLYTVDFSGSDANLTFVTNVDFEAHIAYDAPNDLLYMVNVNGSFVRVYDPSADTYLGDITLAGDLSTLTALIFNPNDGLLYVGDSNEDKIYQLSTVDGSVTFFANGPVSGGDLAILSDGSIYLATRQGDMVYSIVEGGDAVEVGSIPGLVTGMARANADSNSLIISNNGSNVFTQIDASDATTTATYNVMLDGASFTLANGDMAAGCQVETPDPSFEPGGQCYATEVIEYVEGSSLSGGSIALNRTNANEALGEPERTDELVFVSLGYGGSLTLGFDGSVPNNDGDDLEVVETTYGNSSCDSYDEYADVYVSVNGADFFFVRTVCRADGMVDISDAQGTAELDFINYVRIVNNNELSNTPDAFDVDGVVAIPNCIDEDDDSELGLVANDASVLSSYPNPTAGNSQVVMVSAVTARTLVEVYDMNGRNVSTLFNQVANAGQEYRIDFDGTALPNGVYIYRMTSEKETLINKFMIAR